MRAGGQQRGQASVETVALVPLLLALAAGAWQGLLIAWALVAAGHAAGAGAHAELAGGRVRPAVVAALPATMRAGLQLKVGRTSVHVRVAVPSLIPGVVPHVDASAPVAAR